MTKLPTPAEFNHIQDLLKIMDDQDKILDSNPLNGVARRTWVDTFSQIPDHNIIKFND